ncbi:hypothetical protein DOTSEDRAFT_71092 [Dothistroma septosporum NZE10]|uniref:BTB domain-containing protein n=1 Tax=Dothistroma septosporum (strain NZE10 / CBS 128990) TaxID=675120 RepID=N1PQP5_DOTSN|nr:hypothetical protein DOTSEDRAFT_71092 [Dothistroma septosporum NZE10]
MTTKGDHIPSTQDISHNVDEHYDLAVRLSVGKGPKAKLFDIHRGVLQFYSGYFRTAIKNIDDGKFAEGANGVIALTEEDLQTFTLFKRWLYAPQRHMLVPQDRNKPEYQHLDYDALSNLWCFAAQRIIPMLQNRAVDLIIAKTAKGSKMSTSTVRYIFTQTGIDSPLRRLTVFYEAHYKCLEMGDDLKRKEITDATWFGEFCKEIAIERYTGSAVDTSRYANSGSWSRCPYHVHEEGAQCDSRGWGIY